jgi:hypothetical protein
MTPRSWTRSRGRWSDLELASRVEGLDRKLRELEGLASRLEATVKPPAFNIEPDLELLFNVMEARMTYRPCRYMDSDGYCTRHFVVGRVNGLDRRKDVIKDVESVEFCYPSILTHRLFCLLCPYHIPAEGEEDERILGDRWVEYVNGRLVFREPEESNT